MSTLAQRQFGSFAGGHHRVRVSLAERPLSRGQARNPVADDAGAERDDRRQRSVHEEEDVKIDDGNSDADSSRRAMVATDAPYCRSTPLTHQHPN